MNAAILARTVIHHIREFVYGTRGKSDEAEPRLGDKSGEYRAGVARRVHFHQSRERDLSLVSLAVSGSARESRSIGRFRQPSGWKEVQRAENHIVRAVQDPELDEIVGSPPRKLFQRRTKSLVVFTFWAAE